MPIFSTGKDKKKRRTPSFEYYNTGGAKSTRKKEREGGLQSPIFLAWNRAHLQLTQNKMSVYFQPPGEQFRKYVLINITKVVLNLAARLGGDPQHEPE